MRCRDERVVKERGKRHTIKRILLEHGLEPAPSRGSRMPWGTFLKAHLGSMAATDFFSVEVLTLGGLVRYFVLFVIDIETRRVHLAGIVRQPHGAWMKQIARNLTDHVDGFLWGTRYLIHDRDPLFTDEFRELLDQRRLLLPTGKSSCRRTLLRTAGVKCLKLPAQSPNLNAFAERFVLSIKSECLDKLVLLGERHLHLAVAEYLEHYHVERNHQGLDNQLITTTPLAATLASDNSPVVRRESLGGLLSMRVRLTASNRAT